MQLSANGLAGHLHDFYRFVAQSSWVGGDQEYSALNEGFPYWFNGLVHLAYGLDDARLKSQVHEAVTYVISHQASDGWLGSETGNARNLWARYPFLLGLIGLVEADPSYKSDVLDALHKFNKLTNKMLHNNFDGYLYQPGDAVSSFDTSWGRVRVCDLLISLQWLFENDPRDQGSVIVDNMQLLINESLNWKDWYNEQYPKQDLATLPDAQIADTYWYQHGVNVGQGLKAGAVFGRLTRNSNDSAVSRRAVAWTQKYHGASHGVTLADERQEGLTPFYGTELCTVVETMYSLSYLYQTLGDSSFADNAELAAFNALPAMLTADHWAHQYVQQVNQPYSKNLDDGTPFYNVNNWGQTFGLEPDFPCCTVNHPQGLPKYVAAMFSGVGKNGTEGLAHTLLGPASAKWTLAGGNKVKVNCTTNYPFGNVLIYQISASKAFDFYVRLPSWAKSGANVTGSGGSLPTHVDSHTGMQKLSVKAGTTTLVYSLPAQIAIEQRSNDTIAVHHGALLYALEIGSSNTSTSPRVYTDSTHNEPAEGSPKQARDYQMFNTTAWNVAVDPSTLRFSNGKGGALANPIFAPGAPPSKIMGKGCKIDWPLYRSVPSWAPPKAQRKCIGKAFDITLRPYGSTKIRMAELPTIDLGGVA